MSRKAWTLLAAIGVLAIWAVPRPALSYLLPSEAILSSVAVRRDQIGFDTLVATGSYQKGNEPPIPVWEGVRAGKAQRTERKRGDLTEVILTAGTRRWRFNQGSKAGPVQKIEPDLVMTFLANTERDPGGKRGLAFLVAHNIDPNIVSLGRLDKHIAYVIGAKPNEIDKPQLWIDKQLKVPIRLISVDKGSATVSDLRLLGFGSAATSEWYPSRVELWQNGSLIEATTYGHAELNTAIDDQLFAPPSS